MQKKLTAVITICILLAICICLPLTAFAAEQAGELRWEVRDNTLYISGNASMENYTYGTSPWFAQAENITAVVVETGVASIGEYGLAGLTKAVKITLPEGITQIGYQAFQNCAALTDIHLPTSLTAIGQTAFANCTALKRIEIPQGITALPAHIFYNCSALETVVLPDTLTSVEEDAFSYCTALKTVHLPDSVTHIGNDAFVCSGIETIDLPDNITNLEETFRYCHNLKQVTLPENLQTISWAFQECESLEELVFPAGIQTIGEYTLYDCTNMRRIIFQGDLPSIDLVAFQIDEVEIYVPANNESWQDLNVLKNYGADPVYYLSDAGNICSNHSFGSPSVVIPNTCVTYGAMGVPCTNCSAVRLDPLSPIDHYCSRRVVQPGPDTVGYYEDICFYCGWQTVTFLDDIMKSRSDAVLFLQDALIQRKTGSFEVVFWDNTPGDKEKAKKLLDEALVHNGIPACGDYLANHLTLSSCSGSTHYEQNGEYLNILEYSFGYYTTKQEEQLVNVWLTDILKELALDGRSDFEKTLLIHDYVVNRLVYDFSLSRWSTYLALRDGYTPCQGYATLMYRLLLMAGVDCRYIRGDTPEGRHGWNIVKLDGMYYCLDATWDDPVLGFENHDYFLKGTAEFFKNHTPDPDYQTLEFLAAYPLSETDYREDFGYCGDSSYWWLESDGTLVIAGTGSVKMMFDWPGDRVKRVLVKDGITKLEGAVFFPLECLEEIFFEGDKPQMTGLGLWSDVTACYPANNPTWQDIASDPKVTWRPYLEYGTLGDNIRWVCFADNTLEFFGNGKMEETFVAPWVGYYQSVQKVIFHEGITYICEGAFSHFSQLKSVDLPSTLISIGPKAFMQCPQLTDVTFPQGLETIGANAFYNCGGLTQVLFPDSLTHLGEKAFGYCHNLTEITFRGNAPTFVTDAFYANYFLTAYYPANKGGWTENVRQDYGGSITWVPYENAVFLGDINQDGNVNNDDVVLLLWHTLFPEDYPLYVSGDLTGEGEVNNDDVILLLWHTLFPEEYPL